MKILVTGGSGFIGTNYIEFLKQNGQDEFINLDSKPPRNPEHQKFWLECDMMDFDKVRKRVEDFQPSHVVHLAAKIGLYQKELNEFEANIEGVQGLIDILRKNSCVERVIFTSSLLVCKMGYVPERDDEYKPTTLYGQSKVCGEQIVRSAENLHFSWTIIRPISVWGPYAEEPYRNFFQSVSRNLYFHIGSGHYRRSMGYVENMVRQIHSVLLAPKEKVDRKVFYLGDSPPVDLYEFANEVQRVLGVRRIRHLPIWAIRLGAKIGDALKALGWRSFPLTSFRLNNIQTEYMFNLKDIMDISGPLSYDFRDGIQRTVKHMRKVGEI